MIENSSEIQQEKDQFNTNIERSSVGVVKYSDGTVKKGDIIGYKPSTECEFIVDGDFKWDWLVAGCKSDTTGEEFKVYPDYPKGKPDELIGIEFDLERLGEDI